MYYFKVILAYKGSQYFGWQAQSADTLYEEKPTVQGTVLNALKKMANYQSCNISAASRTDAGVHAQGQLAKVTLPDDISPENLQRGLNSLLPTDIRIIHCETATKEYQPNRASISKEYHYYFTASPIDNVAVADIAAHIPVKINAETDLIKLRQACQLFVGRHDFYSFSSRDKSAAENNATTVREVFYCDIHPADFSPLAPDLYYLKIIGDGFLKHMVRYLMGALFELLKAKIQLNDIERYLQHHQADKLSRKAKPKGLHLIKVEE